MNPLASTRRAIAAALLILASAAMGPALAQGSGPVEPGAGSWRTWVLTSGSQFRLPPPPGAEATAAEARELASMAAGLDAATRQRVAWWNAVAPSYRWNGILMDELVRAQVNSNYAGRHLAVLHTALADATIAAWDSKVAHGRQGPTPTDPTLAPAARRPSYPDEHAVAGAVASAVLGAIFPQRAAEFARLAQEEARARLLAGVAYPSDVAAGTQLGRQVAAVALERAAGDGFGRPWTGSVPTTPGSWNGTNPITPDVATWRPWLMRSPNEFRPAPPPAFDSSARAEEMAVLRSFERTPRTNALAAWWEVAVGGLRNYQYWNAHLGRLLLESGQAANAPRVARAYALAQVAFMDAGIACWDAKYTYWTIRPFQLDPNFRTVVPTPNHPSYPAAHACFSETWAAVLGHLFPADAADLAVLGREAGESRIWAGIHYPSDIAASRFIAERVSARVIERAQADGAGAMR